MRRVWATVVSVWATLAIVAGLAWTRHAPATPLAQPAPATLVVKGKTGTQRFVVLGATSATASATAAHATTHPSPPPVG